MISNSGSNRLTVALSWLYILGTMIYDTSSTIVTVNQSLFVIKTVCVSLTL